MPRCRRGIKYAGPLVMDNKRRCLLDHSHALMMTARLPHVYRTMASAPPLPHHRRGLAEQDLALLLGAIHRLAEIRIDLLGPRIGALGGGPRLDVRQPALHVGEV